MTQSSLCTYRHITKNKNTGRGGERVCKITPHYMAAKWSGRQCADYFASTSRQASSNYCIGVNGDIAMSVDEDDRAWTSSSGWNDRKAITIECGNVSNATGEMTQATWNSLVSLCVDICKRYGFRLTYDGTRNGSLTEHRMFASTDCPGQWLHARMGQLAKEVNARLDGTATGQSQSTSGQSQAAATGYLVKVTASVLNIRKGPGTNYAVTGQIKDKGTYTIVAESSGTGASKWGKLKSGAGWISLDYATKTGSTATAKKSVDEVAREVIAGKWGNGSARKSALTAAGYDYAAVQARVNQLLK